MKLSMLEHFNMASEPWVCSQCGYCRVICPVFDQLAWESTAPRGKIYYMKLLLGGKHSLEQRPFSDKFAERVFQCTLCGHCKEVCQSKIDLTKLWTATRAELGNRGLLPPPAKEIDKAVLKENNIFSMPNSERTIWSMMIEEQVLPRINKPAKIAYFIGCVSAFTGRIASIPESTVRILDSAGVNYTILGSDEWCCGHPLILAGKTFSANRLAEHNLRKLKELGVEKLVTNCAGCYLAFKHEYPTLLGIDPEIEIEHFSQFLSSQVNGGRLKFKPRTTVVTYHDPCEIGRLGGIYEEPRQILENLPGVKLLEMPYNRERSNCCGGGGLLKATNRNLSFNIAEKRLKEAEEIGAANIATACVACKLHMTDVAAERCAKMAVYDIAELVAEFLA
ncbi:(Fe-S)-binding protein [Candidatus Hecatella orcuttiae]|uniref:(Fe-S)-binding protein n=1 Tax=Candidatus Hecatella orcuttiae TaxID=1935119 RepID=UPI00286826E6|nr:(Fe-S)-binding protein [Candidatus Hecatella orcuttiae]